MLHINKLIAAALLVTSAVAAHAGNLWIVGDATPNRWDLDKATALVSRPESQVYTGTLYLIANQGFKFLTTPEYLNLEYGAAEGAVITNGKIQLAEGTNDEGYAQIKVAEDGNYYISVNLETKEAEIVKSAYQESEIKYCSLFMVGTATPGKWELNEATPLYQEKDTPYVYKNTVTLKSGSFKIATAIKNYDHPENWFYKDANDPDKMVLGQAGDVQWEITKDSSYTVTANTLDNSISIKDVTSGVAAIATDNAQAVYYTLDGVKVNNPAKGLYIVKQGSKVSKVILK